MTSPNLGNFRKNMTPNLAKIISDVTDDVKINLRNWIFSEGIWPVKKRESASIPPHAIFSRDLSGLRVDLPTRKNFFSVNVVEEEDSRLDV